MAAFTLVANTNVDALVGRVGGDTLVNGGFDFIMDEDSRYGLNANTSAIWAAITGSNILGGDIKIDGRFVRLIAYNTGSGNVPAYNTTITRGGASGLLIGVYASLSVAPTAPGAAMPTSGFIKIKQWNSVAYTTGALTGIGATATAADRVGWIEIVGQEASAITINGLNNQSSKVARGARFDVGTTPGTPARTDTYQLPTNGNTFYAPGVFVENTPGGFVTGDYEFWPTTADTATIALVATDSYRGKYCWISTAGVLTFGNDGTNSTGGALPNANCGIGIGNVFLNNAASATKTVNSMSATVGNRYFFSAGALATFEMEWVSCNWRVPVSTPKRFNIESTALASPVSITQPGETMIWNNSGIGSPVDASLSIGCDFVTAALGGTFTNVTFGMGKRSTVSIALVRDNASDNMEFDRCRVTLTGYRPNTSCYAFSFLAASNIHIHDCVIGGHVNFGTGSNYWLHDNSYFMNNGSGLPSNAADAVNMWSVPTVTTALIEDELFPLAGQVPRGGFISISANSRDVTMRNIGSYTTPVDCTGYAEDNVTWTRAVGGVVATVTTTSPHNLAVGDTVVVYRVLDTGTITKATKSVATVPTSTTFTFACVNSGPTTGILSFYTALQSVPINIAGNNVTNVKIQNFWTKGHSAQPFTMNATAVNVLFQNIGFEPKYVSHPQYIMTNAKFNSLLMGVTNPSSGAGVIGTHFSDEFTLSPTLTGATGCAWTRSAGTVTMTSANHGLLTGSYIQLYDATSPLATTPGPIKSVTVLDKDTFTFSGANSSLTSGTSSYRVSNAQLNILLNDPNTSTASQVTVNSGNPRFTGAGSLASFAIGDGVTWETPDYILGFDNFAKTMVDITGSTNVIQHYNAFYDLDRGSGFSGTYKNLYYQRPGGAGTIALSTLTMTSTTGVNVGDYVFALSGGGLADGVTVVSVDTATQITVNTPNVGAVSGVLVFAAHYGESTFPSTGVKFRIRTLTFGAPTTATTGIFIPMLSTAASRQRLYPQDVDTYAFGLTNIPSGSIVAVYDSTDTELARDNNVTSGVFQYDYIHSGTDTTDNYAVVWHEDYYPIKYTGLTFAAADQSIYVAPEADLAYDNAAPDISTFNYTSKIHIMDPTVTSGGDVNIPITDLYSNWKDDITLSNNFTYAFAYEVVGGQPTYSGNFVSINVFQQNGWKLRPKEINHTGRVTGGNLIPETGGAVVPTVGSFSALIEYQNPERSIGVSTGSGVTPTDKTDIIDGVWAKTLSSKTAGDRLTDADKSSKLVKNILL